MSIIRKLFGLGPKKNEEKVTEVIALTPTGPAPIVTKDDIVQTVVVPDEKPAKVARVKRSTPKTATGEKKTVVRKTTKAPKQ
jgi:hypothetical protein